MELTGDQIKKILPSASKSNINKYLPYINQYMEMYGINTPLRVSGFIAQVGHESGSFVYVREIASGAAYEGRKDLGNTQKGDGVRFKGRGLIQITGRANYTKVSEDLGIDCINHPELLEQPNNAVQSACWFWQTHGLNEIADNDDIVKMTKVINGGTNGLNDRTKIYNKAKQVLGA